MKVFPPPPWSWPFLPPLGLAYRAAAGLRQALYGAGILRPVSAGCPVLSVGNLTVGGSGKTPLVDYLLRAAVEAGIEPVCLSRGYGGRTRSAILRVRADEGTPPDPAAMGDEPAMLALRNPRLAFYAGRDRKESARLAALWDAPGLILLDDGYQHLALARELNLLLVDAERGFGNGRVIPWGPLREPLRAARRADAILITKANLGDGEGLRRRLRETLGEIVPYFLCDYLPGRVRRLDGGAVWEPEALKGLEVTLISAIAQPDSFVRAVTALGARVKRHHAFPDHFRFDGESPAFSRLRSELSGESRGENSTADAENKPAWLTTEKDAVKLKDDPALAGKLWVLEMEVRPEPAARAFFFDFMKRAGIG